MYKIESSTLVDDKHKYLFSRDIRETVLWKDIVIVRLAMIVALDCMNNIYAIKDGRVLWQIQDQRHYNPKLLGLDEPLSVYTMVAIHDKDSNLLVATDSMGYRYLVDPTSGLIVGQDGWTK